VGGGLGFRKKKKKMMEEEEEGGGRMVAAIVYPNVYVFSGACSLLLLVVRSLGRYER
jgi:hypothetical protein